MAFATCHERRTILLQSKHLSVSSLGRACGTLRGIGRGVGTLLLCQHIPNHSIGMTDLRLGESAVHHVKSPQRVDVLLDRG